MRIAIDPPRDIHLGAFGLRITSTSALWDNGSFPFDREAARRAEGFRGWAGWREGRG
jgi:hypothetical protein